MNASTGGVGPLPIITTLFADPLNVVSTDSIIDITPGASILNATLSIIAAEI